MFEIDSAQVDDGYTVILQCVLAVTVLNEHPPRQLWDHHCLSYAFNQDGAFGKKQIGFGDIEPPVDEFPAGLWKSACPQRSCDWSACV
ncbi:hypothetical protein D3C85_1698700 [compost metagenome]